VADVPVTIEFQSEGDDAIRDAKALSDELDKTNKASDKSVGVTNLLVFARRRLLAVSTAIAAVGLGKKLLSEAKAIDTVSQAFEVSSEKVQAWAIAAEQSKTSIDSINEAILSLAREQGADSSVFRKMGLDLQEVRRAQPEELFEMVRKKIEEGGMTAIETGAAVQAMGSKGEEVFLALSNGFSLFAEQAKQDGRVISEGALDPMNESLSKLDQSFDRLVGTIKGSFTPALEVAAKMLTPIIEGASLAAVGAKGALRVGLEAGKLGLGLTLPGGSVDTGKLARGLVRSVDNLGANAIADLIEQQDVSNKTRTDKGATSSLDLAKRLAQAQRFDDLSDKLGGNRKAVDGFARAGLGVTPGASIAQTSQQKQVHLLRRIAENTRETTEAVNRN